jgi:hypothetical protein
MANYDIGMPHASRSGWLAGTMVMVIVMQLGAIRLRRLLITHQVLH